LLTQNRYRYFSYVLLGAFCWYWFPGFIFQALSVFAWPTWIAPDNVVVNQVFGGFSGMALLPFTFDCEYFHPSWMLVLKLCCTKRRMGYIIMWNEE
jgi:hypothetical protein